jgi:hypothetical protein
MSSIEYAEKATARDVREWAKANGHVVAGRGRLSVSLRAAYTAATGRDA